MSKINFFYEDTDFKVPETSKIKCWLLEVAQSLSFEVRQINYIVTSDAGLLIINKTYLGHDYYTDIITFDQSEDTSKLEADIFISIDRVHANANKFHCEPKTELLRVLIHGLLHLCGFNDKTGADSLEMRKKEDDCLARFDR